MFSELKPKIAELEKLRASTVIFCICSSMIDSRFALQLHRILRKLSPIKDLDLILESGGGQIDSAAKVVNILKAYSDKFRVIVPFYAKSAASFLAISADEFQICKAGELGPIDPQVRHPVLGMFFPASSIKDALNFIETTRDPYIKMTMADKLDPLLIGAYKSSERECHQYIEECPTIKNLPNKDDIVHALTEKYIDHGYPITSLICKELGMTNCNSDHMDKTQEDLIYDIFDTLIDSLIDKDTASELIILSSKESYIRPNQKIMKPPPFPKPPVKQQPNPSKGSPKTT